MSHNDENEIDISQEVRQSLIGLDPDARYAIRVRSIDGLGNKSDWSEAMEFETAPGNSARPSVPSNIQATWTDLDIETTWNPVFTREDGAAIDINNYEFVVFTGLLGGTLLYKRYPVYGTSFTYTRDRQVEDLSDFAGGGPINYIIYWITAVSRTGQRSREPSYSDVLGIGAHAAQHLAHDPTRAPRAQDIGNRVLITMYREHDCYESFHLYMSSDGGSSWTNIANPTSETYVYTPPSDGTYYFKYSCEDSVREEETAYSPAAYVDYTSDLPSGGIVYATEFATADIDGSGDASVSISLDPTPAEGILALFMSVTADAGSAAWVSSIVLPGKTGIMLDSGVGWVSYALSANTFYMDDFDLNFHIDGATSGGVIVAIYYPT